jgi:outer membrane protein assembly factor BamB
MKRLVLYGASCVLLLAILCSCTRSHVAGRFDWPQWRGPDSNGLSRETDWDFEAIRNPGILWKANVGIGYSNVAIEDGWLYATGTTRGGLNVSCLDAANGGLRWQRFLASSRDPQATPAVDGDLLLVLTVEGALHALDPRNGTPRWSRDLVADFGAVRPFYGFAGSPVIQDDLIILTANSAGLVIDRKTGSLVWGSDPPPPQFPSMGSAASTGTYYSSPVLFESGGTECAIIAGWEGLSAVKVRTGRGCGATHGGATDGTRCQIL